MQRKTCRVGYCDSGLFNLLGGEILEKIEQIDKFKSNNPELEIKAYFVKGIYRMIIVDMRGQPELLRTAFNTLVRDVGLPDAVEHPRIIPLLKQIMRHINQDREFEMDSELFKYIKETYKERGEKFRLANDGFSYAGEFGRNL